MQAAKKSFKLSIDRIAWLCRRSKFDGFMGVQCPECKVTANVVVAPTWTCVCGDRNFVSREMKKLPYDKPDLGPTSNDIHIGFMNADDARNGH